MGDTCAHSSNEDCMNCAICGRCSENLDKEDVCTDCREEPPSPGKQILTLLE
jgi:hypothetical protein